MRFAITSVNNGSNPTAGVGFPVIVQAQLPNGSPVNATTATGVSLSLKTGTGTLGGTLTGTIAAGSNQVTISGVTYTKAESGVVITATRTSGDNLTAGDSAAFTVSPGTANKVAFATQPGNTTAGSALSGPPTVVVQDSLGNAVTSSTASITVAIGTNPNGGTLSGTTTRNALSGAASFTDLSINLAGNGYTLTASANGLTSAVSSAFNVTSTGGTIAGIITRVSNGAAISGALVEAIQGSTVAASATTNASGTYSITGLAAGIYTVKASYVGLVPQILNNVTVATASTTSVNLSLNFGIAVHSPVAGATVNDFSVLVTGNFDTSLAPEVGIQVNGYLALRDGNEFSTIVPIDSQTTALTATITDTAGNQLAGDAVPITPQVPTTEPYLTFRPFPLIALAGQPVSFTLTSLNQVSQIQLDGNGDGTIDFTGTNLDGVSVTFAESGLYYPTVTVNETGGGVRTATAIVQVLDMNQMDVLLQGKWTAMKNALRAGNTAGAASYFVNAKRATYQNVFNNLTIPFISIDQVLGNITYVAQRGANIEYEMTRVEGGTLVTYMVLFGLDEDGVWRIKFF